MKDTRLRREKKTKSEYFSILRKYIKCFLVVIILSTIISLSYLFSIIDGNIISRILNENDRIHSIIEKIIPLDLKIIYGENIVENKERIVKSRKYSSGQATYTISPNSQIEFAFSGTAVEWVSFKGMHNGKANIFLNGNFIRTVDLYSKEVLEQESIYKSGILPDEKHILLITTLKGINEFSRGNVVGVDHFNQWDKEGNIKQIDDNDPSINYINANQLFYLQFIIRKLLHITVYFTITSLLIAVIILLGLKLKWFILMPFVSIGLALIDEYRQIYAIDRDGSIIDILIDCIGIFISIVLFIFLFLLKKIIKSK